MTDNNINNLTFKNHDTYVYYARDWLKNEQIVNLIPTNPENTDIVRYSSDDVDLFTNGVKSGVLTINDFRRRNLLDPNNSINSVIGTIITNDGILVYNSAFELNSKFLTNIGLGIKTLATYKSGKYANYINVEIQFDIKDGYRIVTISY